MLKIYKIVTIISQDIWLTNVRKCMILNEHCTMFIYNVFFDIKKC